MAGAPLQTPTAPRRASSSSPARRGRRPCPAAAEARKRAAQAAEHGQDGDIPAVYVDSGKNGRRLVRLFKCPEPGCDRTFDRKYNQKVHMRIHDGQMPYKCTLCDKSYRWRTSLQHHMRHHDKQNEVVRGRPNEAVAARLVLPDQSGQREQTVPHPVPPQSPMSPEPPSQPHPKRHKANSPSPFESLAGQPLATLEQMGSYSSLEALSPAMSSCSTSPPLSPMTQLSGSGAVYMPGSTSTQQRPFSDDGFTAGICDATTSNYVASSTLRPSSLSSAFEIGQSETFSRAPLLGADVSLGNARSSIDYAPYVATDSGMAGEHSCASSTDAQRPSGAGKQDNARETPPPILVELQALMKANVRPTCGASSLEIDPLLLVAPVDGCSVQVAAGGADATGVMGASIVVDESVTRPSSPANGPAYLPPGIDLGAFGATVDQPYP